MAAGVLLSFPQAAAWSQQSQQKDHSKCCTQLKVDAVQQVLAEFLDTTGHIVRLLFTHKQCSQG